LSVLHDYDMPSIRPRWALKRGLKLILYAFMKKLGLTLGCKDIYAETDAYALALAKLDVLCGIHSVMGLRDGAASLNTQIELYAMKTEIHRHAHFGNDNDPERKRLWDPPLFQSPETWRYDQKWIKGKAPKLKENELPLWHVDYPWMIGDYIDFLYRWRIKGEKIYG